MKEDKDLLLYCDFHGHSRKKNIFMCKIKYYILYINKKCKFNNKILYKDGC